MRKETCGGKDDERSAGRKVSKGGGQVWKPTSWALEILVT